MLGGARSLSPTLPGESAALSLSAHMVRKILGRDGEPIFLKYTRHERGIPQLLVGHEEKMTMMKEWLRREAPGLFLAGTSFQGAGLENAVLSGKHAAESAAKYFQG